MSTALVEQEKLEQVLLRGDLSSLTPAEKVAYNNKVCESLGLNPLTRPFEYIKMNGKEVLYAKRDATEQLRKVHNVSVQITSRESIGDVFIVTARARLSSGREDESVGAVPIAGLKGEALANAFMKAETKAKRRVTLAICGLGMLDETEVGSVPQVHHPKPFDIPTQKIEAVKVQETKKPEIVEPAKEKPLSEEVIPFGTYKGVKLGSQTKAFWSDYYHSKIGNLEDPHFPEAQRKEFVSTMALVEAYINE